MPDVTIVQNTTTILTADQPPEHAGVLIFAVIPLLIMSVVLVRMRAWKGLALMCVLGPLFLLLIYPSGIFYRVIINKQSHEITSEKIDKTGKILTEEHLAASQISSAEMQFNRGDRMIVLIHRDGKQSFPLGEEYIQNAPTQYVVLTALREVIGQSLDATGARENQTRGPN